MTSVLDGNSTDPVKVLVIGKSGAGKTGALASLIPAGYKLRIIDTDKGVRPLRSLLRDERYPYSAACRKFGIDLNDPSLIDAVAIDQKMKIISGDIVPADARGWTRAVGLVSSWGKRLHGDQEIDYGSAATWGTDTVLVIDSFSTLAKMCYYFVQSLNGRLGKADSGYDYQRDVGGAQSHLARLLELLYCTTITCNVIIISHITWVDDSRGYNQSPEQMLRDQQRPNPDGYPSAIGRALSPVMGKYFNDVFVVKSSGSGEHVKRTIATVPTEGVICKNSTFLQPSYDVATGMAEIFSAMREVPLPDGFLAALGKSPPAPKTAANARPAA